MDLLHIVFLPTNPGGNYLAESGTEEGQSQEEITSSWGWN